MLKRFLAGGRKEVFGTGGPGWRINPTTIHASMHRAELPFLRMRPISGTMYSYKYIWWKRMGIAPGHPA